MIVIHGKHECCGCSACVQKCPRHCITLDEDDEGFLYPKVDMTACIDCGLCEQVCPWLNRSGKLQPIEVLAAKNRNEEERMDSSSGGVFIALAREVICRGGVVFGAVFDENWEVKHTYAETLEDVRPMMGSKYVQSRVGKSYRDAERFLKDGREVLFVGTPCQVAGLYGFLHKDYPNLLSVDVLCHGVPSPGVWRRYLNETFYSARRVSAGKDTVLSCSLSPMPVIKGIEFRDKRMTGWKEYSFVVCGKDAFEADQNTVLLSAKYNENVFMRGFLADIYLRPSCYRCRCKNGMSHSDLTIADFWGVNLIMPDFDDDKGVGLVLVNTGKGKAVFDGLNMEVRLAVLEDAMPFNGGFKELVQAHPGRARFFRYYSEGKSVVQSVNRCLHVSVCRRILQKVRHNVNSAARLVSWTWKNGKV